MLYESEELGIHVVNLLLLLDNFWVSPQLPRRINLNRISRMLRVLLVFAALLSSGFQQSGHCTLQYSI